MSEKYRSSIQSPLLQKVLFRGTFLGGLGIFLLLVGSFISPNKLKIWGPIIFLLGLGLIGYGLIPYRRLKKLEIEPHEILILDDTQFLFCWRRKPAFTVRFNRIEKVTFIHSNDIYGIGIFLKDSSLNTVKAYDETFDLKRFQKQSIKRYGCDLFLPYFSERTYRLIFPTE